MAKSKSESKSETKLENMTTTTQDTKPEPQPAATDQAKRIPVQMLRHDGPYNPGEIAGFSEDVTTRLIEAGKAKLCEPTA